MGWPDVSVMGGPFERHRHSINLSIPLLFKDKLYPILKKHKAIYKNREHNFRTKYFYKINNYTFYTIVTNKNIIITFKGINSYYNENRSNIFKLIKDIGHNIKLSHIQRLDVCIDFSYNDTFAKHLKKDDLAIYSNMRQPFSFKKFKLKQTAPLDEVERYEAYINDKEYFSTSYSNTTYLHYRETRKGSKNKFAYGLGNTYFKSYYYDKVKKAHEKGKLFPSGVVRLEYSLRSELLNKLDIHGIYDLYKKLPKVIDKISNSLSQKHNPTDTELFLIEVKNDREFLKLLSFFWKKKTKISKLIQEEDNENIFKLNILKDIENGLTNKQICEKYNFTNQRPITKLRKL